MRKPRFEAGWSEFFKSSYQYDELEVWDGGTDLGYAYAYRNRRDPILQAVQQTMAVGSRILDVAAAGGNFTLPLAEKGFRMVWNDLRPECADWVRLKYEYGEVDYVVGNIFERAAQFREFFDAVIATEVIEHVAHPDEFLGTIASLVRSQGRIFLTTPNGRYFRFGNPKFSDCADPSVYESGQFRRMPTAISSCCIRRKSESSPPATSLRSSVSTSSTIP